MFKNYIAYIFLFLILLSICCYSKNKEYFSEDNKLHIDFGAFANLAYIANELQNENGLIIPGDVKVKGKFNYLPIGSIIAFNSSEAPEGWAICNGENGTPDLRNRFILGSGKNFVGKTGGEENVTLTQNQMPKHNHTMSNNGSHSHRTIDNFNHYGKCFGKGDRAFSGGGGANFGAGGECMRTSSDGSHNHDITYTGGNKAHNNMPPFYVLTYIMKL